VTTRILAAAATPTRGGTPLFQGLEGVAVRDTVRGFVAGGSALDSSENSEDWWLAR